MVAEDLISAGYPLVQKIALEFSDKLPAGTTIDDLVSHGGEELLRAHNTFDPACGRPWKGFLAKWLRFQYRDFLRTVRKRAKRQRPLEIETADGERIPRPDSRAVDPSDDAERRDGDCRDRASIAALKLTIPSLDAVAAKARHVRQEVFDAFAAGDMADVMRAVMVRAKAGDLAAAKLLLGMLGIGDRRPPEGY